MFTHSAFVTRTYKQYSYHKCRILIEQLIKALAITQEQTSNLITNAARMPRYYSSSSFPLAKSSCCLRNMKKFASLINGLPLVPSFFLFSKRKFLCGWFERLTFTIGACSEIFLIFSMLVRNWPITSGSLLLTLCPPTIKARYCHYLQQRSLRNNHLPCGQVSDRT